MRKITRDAFLYLEGPAKNTFAQCASCKFMRNNKVCTILDMEVKDSWTCALYVPGAWQGDLPARNLTPEEAGLYRGQVQCKRCEYGGEDCGLFKMLNATLPTRFDLITQIAPEGCCNAWTPKERT